MEAMFLEPLATHLKGYKMKNIRIKEVLIATTARVVVSSSIVEAATSPAKPKPREAISVNVQVNHEIDGIRREDV